MLLFLVNNNINNNIFAVPLWELTRNINQFPVSWDLYQRVPTAFKIRGSENSLMPEASRKMGFWGSLSHQLSSITFHFLRTKNAYICHENYGHPFVLLLGPQKQNLLQYLILHSLCLMATDTSLSSIIEQLLVLLIIYKIRKHHHYQCFHIQFTCTSL